MNLAYIPTRTNIVTTTATTFAPPPATTTPGPSPFSKLLDSFLPEILIPAALALVATLLLLLIARWWLRRRRSRVPRRGVELAAVSAASDVIPPLAEPPPPGTAYLVATTPDGTPLHFPLTHAAVSIGRAAGQGPSIVLDPSVLPSAQTVSEQHARIELDGREHILVDLGSTNGVLVNGHRAGDVVLSDGTHVLLGSLGVVYRANGLGGGAA